MSTLLEILQTKIESIVDNPKLQISNIISDPNFSKLLRTSINRLKYLRRKSVSSSKPIKEDSDDLDDLENKIENQNNTPKSKSNPINDMMNNACSSFDLNSKSTPNNKNNKDENRIK